MKHYIVKEDYIDNFDCTCRTLIPEDDLRRMAEDWGMPFEEVLDQVEEASEQTVWVACNDNGFEDVCKAYYTREAALNCADGMIRHLTESERANNTVSVSSRKIVAAIYETADAAFKAWALYENYSDPDTYEEIEA